MIGMKCEVCGQSATTESIDTEVEDAPVADGKGQFVVCCHAEGPNHHRCDSHPYEIKHRYSDEYRAWERAREAIA